MKIRFPALLVFCFFVFVASSQTAFQDKVKTLLQTPDFKNATVGISVADANTGERIFELNPGQLMIPASTLKLVTTATAIELLGANYRFETKTGYTGKIDENGILNGDLVVVSGGDPTLGSSYFDDGSDKNKFFVDLAKQLKTEGIKEITGNLVLDGSIYQTDEVPPTWAWGDIANYYGANANAFTVYDNLFTITFRSGNAGTQTEIIDINPKIENLEIDNRVKASEINSDQAYVFGSPMDSKRIIRGTIPKDKTQFSIKASIPDPAQVFGNSLIASLDGAGIKINGSIVKDTAAEYKTIFVHQSPELATIIKMVNYESINLFAEHILLQISAEKNGIGNREKSIELLRQFWHDKGLRTEELIMEDGSGLSHFNAVSPGFLTSLLLKMRKSENSTFFTNSFPSAGDGTLSSFSPSEFPGRTLIAKSGSMTRVRCYSGFLVTNSGRELAFTLFFNHFTGSHSKVRGEIAKLLSELK